MSTVEPGRRVALLARPGAARDCVRAALVEVGAELIAEGDPTQADPQTIRDAAPQVLMIVLDATSEDALGRFDGVIGDPSIEVMFEEADVALSREGWEAARWRRHLAAKLRRSDDVLPPVAMGDAPAGDALSMHIEELIAVDEGGVEIAAALDVPADATGGQDFSVFDPAAADPNAGLGDYSLGAEGLEFDPAAFDPAAFDTTAFETPTFDVPSDTGDALPPVSDAQFSASDFDPLLAELDAELPDLSVTAPTPGWNGELVDGFGEPAREAPAPVAEPPRVSFGELSLVDDVAPSTPSVAAGRGAHDLQDLERRISSLQLVDDGVSPSVSTPASRAPQGVVLVMAGMGGPDAVRQFLGALPAGFPRPVLVRQRLDGARYDKLVAQMQRATTLPVTLAEVGQSIVEGTVYVVGDDLGLDSAGGLHFSPGDRLLESLPATESAVVLLSGSEPGEVDTVAALAAQGAWLGAQASDGCYDPTAAQALAARGATSDVPAELARQLARRWGA